ncbi:unnamed protein product [marine sediment metagenome]|uniref:Uncharacterized protein n=1 Tax=marine sediment metagenome TaxID=412755 RepID=X1B8B3_9ZZZZ
MINKIFTLLISMFVKLTFKERDPDTPYIKENKYMNKKVEIIPKMTYLRYESRSIFSNFKVGIK